MDVVYFTHALVYQREVDPSSRSHAPNFIQILWQGCVHTIEELLVDICAFSSLTIRQYFVLEQGIACNSYIYLLFELFSLKMIIDIIVHFAACKL